LEIDVAKRCVALQWSRGKTRKRLLRQIKNRREKIIDLGGVLDYAAIQDRSRDVEFIDLTTDDVHGNSPTLSG